MKIKNTTLVTLTILALACSANAAVIGESPVEGGGTPDGWSGISYLSGYGSLPAGDSVTSWEFYADEGRADGAHSVQPVIVLSDMDGLLSIWDVGPVSAPEEGGAFTEDWGTDPIPDDGNDYFAGVWQWNEGVDNADGGLIPFNGNGGMGMDQIDLDGTSYVPMPGDELESPGHSSGADGRAYQFNFTTAAPGPDVPDVPVVSDLEGTLQVGSEGFGLDQNQWPGAETPDKIIDGVGQKYLNFVGDETGFASGVLVAANSGDIASSITFWTANDAEDRDPASFDLYGTNEDLPNDIAAFVPGDELSLSLFTRIAGGELSLPSTRNDGGDAALEESNSQTVEFSNSQAFDNYLVLFPTVKNADGDNSMQIAEVQLNHADGGIFAPENGVLGLALLPPPSCVPNSGDFNGDGEVNFTDFLTLSTNFGLEGTSDEGDANCDGQVNFADFLTLSTNFGQSVEASQVPEPTGFSLLGIAALVLGCFRKRR